MPSFGPLERGLDVDVCVVGGGIAGLSIAYMLSEAGKSVAVLDDGGLCEGMTQYTTGHLASAIDDRYVEIERLHGEAGARLAAQSHAAAIDRIESIIAREGIECGFSRVDGYLFLGQEHDEDYLLHELEASHRAGLQGVKIVERSPVGTLGPCLMFPNQGQFHVLQYLTALTNAIVRKGNMIFTHTHADTIEGGRTAKVHIKQYLITADAVVVATNSPVNDRLSIHTKQAGYMSYVIGARIPAGTVPGALYWDTEDPYHYVRTQPAPSGDPNYEILIVGGEDHRVGQADDMEFRHGRLENWARRRFPTMENVEYKWAGQVMETVDGLAYIGRNPLDRRNVYISTGDSGMGLTHGTIAGMLITDLILGVPNPWAELYDPSRKSLAAIGEYISENIKTAAQYQDWFTDGDVESADEIANGSGAVIREGASKFAVYRDEDGQVHKYSAVCPHLGGIVRWNSVDKLWDCPCHGSRFSKFGEAVMGPANSSLTPVANTEPEVPHHASHEA
jgi:glycine/D-amino acid oxidase-like deaminating enzyme/nitrite reductase/ring-hydroxylating ferredoxin subunit